MVIHTASILLGPGLFSLVASAVKQDILDQAGEWRAEFPGVKVRFRVIMDRDHERAA